MTNEALDVGALLTKFQRDKTGRDTPNLEPAPALFPQLTKAACQVAELIGAVPDDTLLEVSDERNGLELVCFAGDLSNLTIGKHVAKQIPSEISGLPQKSLDHARDFTESGTSTVGVFDTAAVRSYADVFGEFPEPDLVSSWTPSIYPLLEPLSAFPDRSAVVLRDFVNAFPAPFAFDDSRQPFLPVDPFGKQLGEILEIIGVGNMTPEQRQQCLVGRCFAHGSLDPFIGKIQTLMARIYRRRYEACDMTGLSSQMEVFKDFMELKRRIFEARQEVISETKAEIKARTVHKLQGLVAAKTFIRKEVAEKVGAKTLGLELDSDPPLRVPIEF